jgi:hypothetical protein
MKKLLLIAFLLSGCSVYNQLVERMQTDTLEYRCDEKPLTVKLNNPRQEASFVYDNKLLNLKQGCRPPAHVIPTVSMSSGQKATAQRSTNATALC